MLTYNKRAGIYIRQPQGYNAFIPTSLPPEPSIMFDSVLVKLLSQADQALGRLDGITQIMPNPNLFVAMYVRREAVLSSQIEGTQSTLDDILEYELSANIHPFPQDVEEVVNYVSAMNYGLERLSSLPLSLRLIREIHGLLLTDVRGSEKSPGEFRLTQNWIGPSNAALSEASFIPPPPNEMMKALDDFEKFLHEEQDLPTLIHIGLAHAQFETIHPFLDGNGRVGRLLITFLLCYRGILNKPLLYLSYYLRNKRSQYYHMLMAIREQGDWEGWLRFFLKGLAETAEEATKTAHAIIRLREAHQEVVQGLASSANGLKLLDLMFTRPIMDVNLVKETLGTSFATANKLVSELQNRGILSEMTGKQRNRIFRYSPYLQLFTDPEPTESGNFQADKTQI